MDNNNTTTAYSTANEEEFKLEVISLLKKIRNNIEVSTSKTDIYNIKPSHKMTVNMGVLKIHEFKLSEMLAFLESIKAAQWIEYKEDLVRDFDAAYTALNPAVPK